MSEKYLCIKNIDYLIFRYDYFLLGKVIDVYSKIERIFSVYYICFNGVNYYHFGKQDLKEYFQPLEEWREQQIDKILNT